MARKKLPSFSLPLPSAICLAMIAATTTTLMMDGSHALLLRPPSIIKPSRRHRGARGSSSRSSSQSSSQWSLSSQSSDESRRPQKRRIRMRARPATAAIKGGSHHRPDSTIAARTTTRRLKTIAGEGGASASTSTSMSGASTWGPAGSSSSSSSSSSSYDDDDDDDAGYGARFRRPTAFTKSGAPFQLREMLDHGMLSKEEEATYGRQIVAARELRGRIDGLLEGRRASREARRAMATEEEREEDEDDDDDEEDDDDDLRDDEGDDDNLDYDFLSYELEYLSVYGYHRSVDATRNDDDEEDGPMSSLGGYDLDDDLLIEHAQHLSRHVRQLRREGNCGGGGDNDDDDVVIPATLSFDGGGSGGNRRGDGPRGAGSSAANRNSYSSFLQIPLNELTESDVVSVLDVPGGKAELVRILLDGAHAREALMRGNVKLVMSVAKGWMRNGYAVAGANGEGAPGGGGSGSGSVSGRGDDGTARRRLAQMYDGSWDRPSLDEAVQEGMLGLARAVDKYDPERGLRFSTYATHWITSYVRTCFQRAVTGCLRVPGQLHEIKAAYNRIVRDHLHLGGSSVEPLDRTSIAQRLGISERRLRIAIRATGGLLSVDAPVMSAGGGSGGSYKGSMAGGDGRNNQELLILDTLKCAEPKPEDQVEISFLRQCLENAMATELTPYERDVLRMRLGLDSGESKTVREIVELSGGMVSMADVRGAERRAFKKLRSPASVHTHNLLAYLDFGERAEIQY